MSGNQNQNAGPLGAAKRFCELLVAFVSSAAFLKLALLWFVLQGIFFALTTRVGLPPDENYHVAFIGLFTEINFSPIVANQTDYLALGEVVRTPFFLYHYLLSPIYAVLGGGEQAVVVLRILNVLIGVSSLYLVYKIAGELKLSKLVRNLSIFMLSGTLMFAFIAASVTYDNLFIFLSLAAILLLIRLLSKIAARDLLLLAVVLAAGSLVKLNFLALAFAVLAVLAARLFAQRKTLRKNLVKTFGAGKRLNAVLCVVLLALGLLVIHRYGYNLVKYHALQPGCAQVMTLKDCRQNALFVRNEMVYGEARLTPGKDPFEYVYDWVPLIQDRTYGIMAHEEMRPLRITSLWVQALILLAFVAAVRMWSKNDRRITIIAGICAFYILVVLLDSYGRYLATGRFDFVVHGRYLFGVLPVLYLISNHYIFKLVTNIYTRGALLAISLVMFVLAGLPTYLVRTTPEWYMERPAEIIEQVKSKL